MRKLAAAFVLTALVAPMSAQQPATIRWEPTGGPLVAQQKQIIVQRGRLLLVGTGGQWWRSPDRGKSWKAFEEGTPRPWIVAADEGTLFGDAMDGVLRSIDMGDSWTRCGALPVNRRTGNEVTSIAADESRVYVSIFRVGLFRSDDQCATWMQLATPWKLEALEQRSGKRRTRLARECQRILQDLCGVSLHGSNRTSFDVRASIVVNNSMTVM